MIADWEYDTVFLSELLPGRHPEICSRLLSMLEDHAIEVRFLAGTKDIWARDYSPIQVSEGEFVHFQYSPDYLVGYSELQTGRQVAEPYRRLGECELSSINLDGGNLVSSGNVAIATEKIFRENAGWKKRDLISELCRVLRLDKLITIPKEPYDPIGHADAMVRFIDGTSVLVNDYSAVDHRFGAQLIDELTRHGLSIRTMPYFHASQTSGGIPAAVGCFTNFLHTSKVIVAPTYGHHFDDQALQTLESAFPSPPVVGIECSNLANEGGVLNCIAAGAKLRAH